MTPQELKNSILQLAIQGKLVPQCPTDGNAEDLYKKIQTEKQRLIATGKIKKEKSLPEISQSEIPFDIPETWKWVRWGDISQSIQYGFNAPALGKGDVRMVRISDIQNGKINWETVPFCKIKEEEIPQYLLKKHDILFARTGGTVGKSYLVKNVPESAIYAGYLIRTRYSTMLSPEYLKYFMDSALYWNQLRNGTIATAQPNCNGQTLSKMLLPLPPLAEQKRIVEKIEELLPYVDRYEKAWNELEALNKRFPDDLQKSILQLAIQGKLVPQCPTDGNAENLYKKIQTEKQRLIATGKIKKEKSLPEISQSEIPFDIPETWKWVRLGEIGSWAAGATPSRTNPLYYSGNVPWLKTGNLTDGEITSIPESISELALKKTSLRLNPKGSVLMAMYGATIGKLGILQLDSTTNQACCACIPYLGVFNKYLFFYLMASRRSFIKMGEGGAQPNISKEKIINTYFALPPLAEQKRIVEKIEELLPYVDRYEKAWNELETLNKRFPDDLQKSILQLAIQGKLIPQCPADGNAEDLYKKIQTEKQRLIATGKIKKEKPLPEISQSEIPFDIPETWKWVHLNQIACCGLGKTLDRQKNTGAPKKYLCSINVYWTGIDLSKVKTAKFEESELQKYLLKKGDLLICEGGDVGRSAVWELNEEMYYQNALHRVQFHLGINAHFYKYLLECYKYNGIIDQYSKGMTIKHLVQNSLNAMWLPLPPLAEQKRIVEKIEELLPLCNHLK